MSPLRLLPLLVFVACGKDEPVADDPAVVPWLADGDPGVAAPDIPWLDAAAPDVAPPARVCPTGWVEEPLDGGGHACNPWPSGARETCDVTAAHFPGEAACEPIGEACPAGEWPDDVTDAATWFVAAGGTGDGTRGAPFGDVASAAAVALDGDTIVIGEGTFDGAATLATDVTVRGLCPDRTVLTLSGATPDDAVLTVSKAAVTLTALRISNTDAMGVRASGGALTLEGVVVDDTGAHGVSASRTPVDLHDVRITGIRPRSDDDTLGRGMTLVDSSLVASRLAIDESHQMGLWIEGTADLELEDFVAYGMTPQASDANRGAAVRMYAEGVATVRRAYVEGGNEYAISTFTSEATVFEDLWVQDVGPDLYDGGASGTVASAGPGSFTCAGITVRGGYSMGLRHMSVGDVIGAFDGEDIVVSGIATDAFPYGAGLFLVGPSTAAVRRAALDDNGGYGLYAAAGAAELADVTARGNLLGLTSDGPATLDRAILEDNTRAQITGSDALTATDVRLAATGAPDAAGIWFDGAVTLTRALVEGTSLAGVSNAPFGLGTALTDVIVRDSRADAANGLGLGLNVTGPVTLRRVAIDGAFGAGISAWDGTMDAEDVAITGVAAESLGGTLGFGIAGSAWDATLTRVALRDTQGAGLDCDDCGVIATDLLVSGVAGSGVHVGTRGEASLERAVIEGCSVGLQSQGAIDVTDVVVRDNTVGIDEVEGWLGGVRLTLEGNGTDEAETAQDLPPRP